jgi:transposase
MAKARGYRGQVRHFREIVGRMRPKTSAEAFLRLRTLPGEQAQVDWGHFGHIEYGKARRPLMAFVMVLSYSRAVYLEFFQDARMASFLRGHQNAFEFFGGIPRVVLYDNLKSAVVERHRDIVRLHPTLQAFAGCNGFAARPVAVARGNEKGRVERAIQYIRHSFFAARNYRDIADLNNQARNWCGTVAKERDWPEDRTLTVAEAYTNEASSLMALPNDPFPVDERVEVRAGKTPYIRFDLNDYSVPHDKVRRTLVVHASPNQVRICDGSEEIASHLRSWGRGQQVEDPAHVEALVREKRLAKQQRATDRLLQSAPLSHELLKHIADGNGNLLSSVGALIRLLDDYGAVQLEGALATAIERGTCHLHAVRHILEQQARKMGMPPPVPVVLPDDPRVRDAVVMPHALKTYDALRAGEEQQ